MVAPLATCLLLLHVHAPDIVVGDIRPLLHQLDGGVTLWRQDLHDAVAVPVKRNRRVRLQHLAVQSAQDAHEVVGACGRAWQPESGRGGAEAVAAPLPRAVPVLIVDIRSP